MKRKKKHCAKKRPPARKTSKASKKKASKKTRGRKKNPGRKAKLPPGFKLEPARHGPHGYKLRRDGRLSDLIYTSRLEAYRAAWKWHRATAKKNPGKKAAKAKAKKNARAKKKTAKRKAKAKKNTFSPVLAVLLPNPSDMGPKGIAKRALAQTHGDARAAVAFLSVYLRGERIKSTAVRKAFRAARELLARKVRARKPRRNPSVPPVLSSFLARHKVGEKIPHKKLPDEVRRHPLVKKAARREARLAGVPVHELVWKVLADPLGASPVSFESGTLRAFEYEPPRKSKRAGTPYRHDAGDHGRGRRRTKPAVLAIDARTGSEVLLDQPGTKRSFSSDRGHVG